MYVHPFFIIVIMSEFSLSLSRTNAIWSKGDETKQMKTRLIIQKRLFA